MTKVHRKLAQLLQKFEDDTKSANTTNDMSNVYWTILMLRLWDFASILIISDQFFVLVEIDCIALHLLIQFLKINIKNEYNVYVDYFTGGE